MHEQARDVWSPPPMENASSQIRLLWIHAGDTGDGICFDISIWRLKDAPDFRAISYTWGLPDPAAFVSIYGARLYTGPAATECREGRQKRVRENARFALRQARVHYPESYIWIDSICINQDDLAEKTAQVSMMAEIYAKAVQVLVCIGQSDDSSNVVHKAARDPDAVLQIVQDGEDGLDSWKMRLRFKLPQGRGTVRQLAEHWKKFSAREYFSRLWVIQELYSGKDRLAVLCGDEVMGWGDLNELQRRLTDWDPGYEDQSLKKSFVMIPRISNRISRLNSMIYIGRDSSFSSPGFFWSDLSKFSCEDVRDRVYGVLGIFDWEKTGIRKPLPDYEISPLDLAVNLLPQTGDWRFHLVEELIDLLKLTTLDIHSFRARMTAPPYLERPMPSDPIRWQMYLDGICPVYQDHRGRLCIDICGAMQVGSVKKAIRRIRSVAWKAGEQHVPLRYKLKQEPVQIFAENAVVVIAWPEAHAGDVLVQMAQQCFIMRSVASRAKFQVVGHAVRVGYFELKNAYSWSCDCWKSGPEAAIASGGLLQLSCADFSSADALLLAAYKREQLLALRAHDSDNMASRVARFMLNIPAIGSCLEDSTLEGWEANQLIAPIKDSCTEHDAMSCNQLRRSPIEFALAAGSGPALSTIHTGEKESTT